MLDFYLGVFLGVILSAGIFYLGVVFTGIMTGKDSEISSLMPTRILKRAYTTNVRVKPKVPTEQPEKGNTGDAVWGSPE